jgi:hypothetical protein
MDVLQSLVGLPFVVLRPPNLKLRVPTFNLPEPMTVFAIVMVTYFLFTGGLIYGTSQVTSLGPFRVCWHVADSDIEI